MKKYFWYTSISLVLVLMLNGCSGGGDTNDSMIPPVVNIGIKKSGNISVSSAEDYLIRYEATDSDTKRTVLIFAGIIQEDVNNLENIYVMTFPFEFVGIEIEYPSTFSPAQFLISRCKNQQNITEPQSEIVIQADGGFTYNATLQGLIDKGLVSPTVEGQEDICIYFGDTGDVSGTAIMSDVVTFTAEEINTARAQYESLIL